MHRLTNAKLEILIERTLSMITHQALANQSTPGSGHEPTNTQRRTFIGGLINERRSICRFGHRSL